MFCPQCGSSTAPQTKFCKSCGSELFELVPTTLAAAAAQRHLRQLKGTKWLVLTPFIWLVTLFCAAVAGETHGPGQGFFASIAVFSGLSAASVSVWSIINLWRSGFFKTYREQRVRAEAALLTRKAQPVAAKPVATIPAPTLAPREIAVAPQPQPASLFGTVTEHTTRELQSRRSDSGQIN